MTSKTIFLVGCSAEKRPGKHPAADLYTSERFRGARALVEIEKAPWFILSGKHGLLSPTRSVAAYDFDLTRQPAEVRAMWAQRVRESLRGKCSTATELIVIADEPYYAGWLPYLLEAGYRIKIPSQRCAGLSKTDWLAAAIPTSPQRQMLETIHAQLTPLLRDESKFVEFAGSSGGSSWPSAGVYLFFDETEQRLFDPSAPKILRVGTHGVSDGSASTLWQRLKAHKGDLNGLGNHRTSIFRLHVGTALINKYKLECPTWGSTARPTETELADEMAIERQVSAYMAKLRVCVLPIGDAASKRSDRAYVEQNLIAIISGSGLPLECASESWLGFQCAHPAVRKSSLWNVNHTEEKFDPEFPKTFERFIDVALGTSPAPARSIAPSNWYESSQEGFSQSFLF